MSNFKNNSLTPSDRIFLLSLFCFLSGSLFVCFGYNFIAIIYYIVAIIMAIKFK